MPYEDIIDELALYLESEDTKEWGERTIEKMKAKNCFKGEVTFQKEQKLTQMEYWNNAWKKYDDGDIEGALKIHKTASRYYPEDYNFYRKWETYMEKWVIKLQHAVTFLKQNFGEIKKLSIFYQAKMDNGVKEGMNMAINTL